MTDVDEALRALDAGRPCVMPTDTVYGLAASLRVAGAVDGLFALKDRPRAKAIPVLAADAASLEDVVAFDERARRVASRFWPGPLTIVLPRAPSFTIDLGGDGASIAVRAPAHPIARELLDRSGPLAVTSANRSGDAPMTAAAQALELFGESVVVLDGGVCDGPASTIVDLTGEGAILREGALEGAEVLGA